jgi:hypothetical protein
MQVELTPDEVDVLRQLLGNYLADLSYEIADTTLSHFRDELRAHRSVVQNLLQRLSADTATVG